MSRTHLHAHVRIYTHIHAYSYCWPLYHTGKGTGIYVWCEDNSTQFLHFISLHFQYNVTGRHTRVFVNACVNFKQRREWLSDISMSVQFNIRKSMQSDHHDICFGYIIKFNWLLICIYVYVCMHSKIKSLYLPKKLGFIIL